jgi:hypothetical protein
MCVGFLAASSGKVFFALDFSPQAPGRFSSRWISRRKLREGFLCVGFLAGSSGKIFFASDFSPENSGKVSDASDFLPEAPGRFSSHKVLRRKLREGFRRVGFLAGSSGKVSDTSDFLPEAPGRFSNYTLRGTVLRDNSGKPYSVTGGDTIRLQNNNYRLFK